MDVKFDTSKFEESLKKTEKEYVKKARERALTAAYGVHAEAVKSIQKTSTGKRQKRYRNGRSRVVVSSKPGEAPNIDSGALIRSMAVDFDNAITTAIVRVRIAYAIALEFGTKNMKARPFLGPAFKKYLKIIKNKKW